MPKPFTPKVVTANALLEGDVVYLTADDRWTRTLHEAELLTDEAVARTGCCSGRGQTEDGGRRLPRRCEARRSAPNPPISARISAAPAPPTISTASKRSVTDVCYYTDFDAAFVAERNRQFRAQVERRIDGHLTEDEFKPLRLMNGLYLQLHAYMLRVAIPYGTLTAAQDAPAGLIAERWDKGYGHFTTRQNIQFNWPKLRDVPDMLDALAEVEMHAIQTSGNTIRNVTADHFAGAAADEVADPRPVAELLRQWSTDHPEFQFLPRKFKIAVTGSEQ